MNRQTSGCSPKLTLWLIPITADNADRAVLMALYPRPELNKEVSNSMPSWMVASEGEILFFPQKSSHFPRKVLYCLSVPCRQDAMMMSCAAVNTPVLFNCFRISGTLVSVVEHGGDAAVW